MATKEITDQNFEAEVLKADKPVIVDFWAEWCRQAPSLNERGLIDLKKEDPVNKQLQYFQKFLTKCRML